MFNKIKNHIKNKNYKKRSLILSIIKFLLLTFAIILKLSIGVYMFSAIINTENNELVKNIIISGFFIYLPFGALFLMYLNAKINNYFLSFYTEEEIINNIDKYYYAYKMEKGNGVYKEFKDLYKEREDKILDNLKEITTKLPDNWLINLSGAASVRKLLLSKDIKWYSKQVSKKELYNYCKNTINEIIENSEKEYYQIILEIFEDFIEEEKVDKIKDKLVKENIISIINI